MSVRQLILDTTSDAATDLMCYGRKEDEELTLGAIELAVENGEITVDEIIAAFKTTLMEYFE